MAYVESAITNNPGSTKKLILVDQKSNFSRTPIRENFSECAVRNWIMKVDEIRRAHLRRHFCRQTSKMTHRRYVRVTF